MIEGDLPYCLRCRQSLNGTSPRCPQCGMDLSAPTEIGHCKKCDGLGQWDRPVDGWVNCAQCVGTGRQPHGRPLMPA